MTCTWSQTIVTLSVFAELSKWTCPRIQVMSMHLAHTFFKVEKNWSWRQIWWIWRGFGLWLPVVCHDMFSVTMATEKMGPQQEFHREMVRWRDAKIDRLWYTTDVQALGTPLFGENRSMRQLETHLLIPGGEKNELLQKRWWKRWGKKAGDASESVYKDTTLQPFHRQMQCRGLDVVLFSTLAQHISSQLIKCWAWLTHCSTRKTVPMEQWGRGE